MYGAKINNLGLCLLIRLIMFVEYLSFFGGETQRPILNSHGRVVPAHDSLYPFHINPFYKNLVGKTQISPCIRYE